MNEQYQKAIEWIDERLQEDDIQEFRLEPHLLCSSLHFTLSRHKQIILTSNGFSQKTSYHQVKKLKDWYTKNITNEKTT